MVRNINQNVRSNGEVEVGLHDAVHNDVVTPAVWHDCFADLTSLRDAVQLGESMATASGHGGPVGAIDGCIEHLRGSALGLCNLTD